MDIFIPDLPRNILIQFVSKLWNNNVWFEALNLRKKRCIVLAFSSFELDRLCGIKTQNVAWFWRENVYDMLP